MYTTLLFIHSWLRWIILVLFIVVLVKSFLNMSGSSDYSKGDNAMAASLVGTLHLQLLLGLILYFFLSPFGIEAFGGEVSVMKNAAYRYWAVEHITAMILAVVAAQIGRSKSRKIVEAAGKFKTQAIFFSIALILILSRIPWSEAGRLFRI